MPRYMILIKSSPEAENPTSTGPEIFEEMTTFNEELHAAGVLLSADGLSPTKDGYRVTYSMDGPAQVTKGPFDVAEEGHVCGWWILKTKDSEEAVSWAKKIPFKEGEVTVRKIAKLDDFGDSLTDDVREREKRLAKDLEKKIEGNWVDAIWGSLVLIPHFRVKYHVEDYVHVTVVSSVK